MSAGGGVGSSAAGQNASAAPGQPQGSGCVPLTGSLSSPFGRDPSGFADWTFSTVRCWGEEAQGVYRLVIRDIGESCLPEPFMGQWQQLRATSWGAASSAQSH